MELKDLADDLINIKVCTFCEKSIYIKKKWVKIPRRMNQLIFKLIQKKIVRSEICPLCKKVLSEKINILLRNN